MVAAIGAKIRGTTCRTESPSSWTILGIGWPSTNRLRTSSASGLDKIPSFTAGNGNAVIGSRCLPPYGSAGSGEVLCIARADEAFHVIPGIGKQGDGIGQDRSRGMVVGTRVGRRNWRGQHTRGAHGRIHVIVAQNIGGIIGGEGKAAYIAGIWGVIHGAHRQVARAAVNQADSMART